MPVPLLIGRQVFLQDQPILGYVDLCRCALKQLTALLYSPGPIPSSFCMSATFTGQAFRSSNAYIAPAFLCTWTAAPASSCRSAVGTFWIAVTGVSSRLRPWSKYLPRCHEFV